MDNPQLYESLYSIRRFEETVLEKFPSGVFSGTTHTCIGQEANAVGVMSHLEEQDVIFSSHRGHGHFLAYGGDMRALFAELMGKATGVCGGRGGSQHLQWRNFYSNGVQGGIVPVATGMALAEKVQKSDAVVTAFIGDGTLGEGAVYEALNMAGLWSVPILYVLENNRIAQTTPVELALSGSIALRFHAFDIQTVELDSSDVHEIASAALELISNVRHERAPRALILHTFRFGPHSKGDDTRSEEQIIEMRAHHDPLTIHAQRLSSVERSHIEAQVARQVEGAFQQALKDPYPQAGDL